MSSHSGARQILGLLSPRRAESILKDLANLPGDVQDEETYKRMIGDVERLRRKYPGIFDLAPIPLLTARDLLRRAWTAPETRHANWYLFRLRVLYADALRRERAVRDAADTSAPREGEIPGAIPATADQAKRLLEGLEPPAITEIEAALFYLHRNLRRALYCPNPECPAPYFLSTKKGQKFCSPECAKPSRLDSQRRWWHEHRGKGAKKGADRK